MPETKTINILGETQRQQWHTIVNILRVCGGDMTREGRSGICDELDRYIDAMEDANEDRGMSEHEALVCLAIYTNTLGLLDYDDCDNYDEYRKKWSRIVAKGYNEFFDSVEDDGTDTEETICRVSDFVDENCERWIKECEEE